jgi:antitoxin HicB
MPDYYARFDTDRKNGGYVISFPDLNHGATQGDTIEDAFDMARDLLRGILGELMKRGEALPPPTRRGRNLRLVVLPALQRAKAELYSAFRASGMKKAELARRLGIPRTNIERLFDLDHASRLDLIEAALNAIGKKLEVKISDAA